jgi:S1-C subfamily serine protease
MFLRRVLLSALMIAALQVADPRAQPIESNYRRAEQTFNSALSLDQRIFFQVLLTASGQSFAVPVERFNVKLFNSIRRFQSDNALVPSGIPDGPFIDRLFLLANPMLDLWGFQWVSHPYRRARIWVPLGLGLKSTYNDFGLVFNDQRNRMQIDFTTVPNVGIQLNYLAITESLAKENAKIHYHVRKEDWFVVSFTQASGVDGYMRYHQDGTNVTGFSLFWDNRNGNVNGERVAVLMSASLRSSLSGAVFTDPPKSRVAEAPKPDPESPTEKARAPAPNTNEPAKVEAKISTGTGFFVNSDGSFVTNAHVIEGCSTVLVKTDDAAVNEAKVIAVDATNDLAILRLSKAPKGVAKLRVAPRLGESVAAFGFPHSDMLSSSGNFTLGNITALSGLHDDSRHLQVSAPVQSGNSGGPLLDSYANVIGVVALKLNALRVAINEGDLPQNVNFAVKAAILASFLDSNRVSYESAPVDRKTMEPADIADQARAISGFVACK